MIINKKPSERILFVLEDILSKNTVILRWPSVLTCHAIAIRTAQMNETIANSPITAEPGIGKWRTTTRPIPKITLEAMKNSAEYL